MPSHEKLYSVFEPHPRWPAKGKAGRPVERGVPGGLLEDPFGLMLPHEVRGAENEVDLAGADDRTNAGPISRTVAVPFRPGGSPPGEPAVMGCRAGAPGPAAPGRGSAADRERETEATCQAARPPHPAVESAINHREHRGLDRVRTPGAEGFARTGAGSMRAFNLHRLGGLLRRRMREAERRRSRWAA